MTQYEEAVRLATKHGASYDGEDIDDKKQYYSISEEGLAALIAEVPRQAREEV